jgi:AraC-like DNA-binding protein
MSALNSAQSTPFAWHPAPPAGTPAHRAIARPRLAQVACEARAEIAPAVAVGTSWREDPQGADPHRIAARRWRHEGDSPVEHAKTADPRFAVLDVALRPAALRLAVGGQCVHDGPVSPGFAAITRPGLPSDIQLRTPCDILHLFVPQQRLAEIVRRIDNPAVSAASRKPCLIVADPLIERLAWLLLKGAGDEIGSSNLYLDGIALAIVSRLLESSATRESPSRGLVKWRLKRVQDFVDEQLSESLSLADLARCAGLSRMHFAAQFRSATGMRPHEYLVRRRIQRAQEMLLTTTVPLVEVALSVGFQTQAHFTTVFRRLLGETPGRWRQAQRAG